MAVAAVRTPGATPRVRARLPRPLAFVGTALAFASLYLAAGAPTPLLVVVQREWGFPPAVLTIAFAAYAIALLGALLVFGSLSDHLGRRPVLIGSLLVELVAMVLFVVAPDIGWVIVARVVQGIATGAASSAFAASIVELAPEGRKKLGAIVGSAAPGLGLGFGALLTGLAVQLWSNANAIVFVTLAAVMVAGTLVAASAGETAALRPGVARSLVPRVRVPVSARREFAAAVPVHMGSWMLAGLFMGLAPTIIRDIFHIDSGLLNGATAFLEPAAAGVTGIVLGRVTPRRTTTVGGLAVLAGTAVIVGGVVLGSLPLLWLGGLVGGIGFGASFSGALRTITPLAQSHQRAELFAAVYLVAYLAFGVPTIIAGQLVGPAGLFATVVGYGVAIIVAAAAGLLTQARAAAAAADAEMVPATLG